MPGKLFVLSPLQRREIIRFGVPAGWEVLRFGSGLAVRFYLRRKAR